MDDKETCSDISETSYEPVKKNNKEQLNFINTNARSLCPKIHSFVDCFSELQLTFATVTETWLADGEGLDQDLEDLALGAGISLICRNRPRGQRGVAH